jgi:hypothetical protein
MELVFLIVLWELGMSTITVNLALIIDQLIKKHLLPTVINHIVMNMKIKLSGNMFPLMPLISRWCLLEESLLHLLITIIFS